MGRSSCYYPSFQSPRYRFLTVAIVFFIHVSAAAAHYKSHLCNTFDPQCGVTAQKAIRTFLTPYDQLLPKLLKFKRRARFRMQVGPLIQNSDGDGIIDIDKPLSPTFRAINTSVCGYDVNPTIRDAIICTVTWNAVQPPRGNINASRIGYSTQGRLILALRLGNPRGTSVLVISQQHGNEPASTEAVFKFLKFLQTNPRLRLRLLQVLDIIIVIRANPDGGEPSGETNVPVASFTSSKGFFRHNIDPAAGGGFILDSEPGFFGVVGRGYDLNRYHYVKLDGPIRPVETQALVGAQLAFRPEVIIDMHGDVQKSVCEVDGTSIVPGSFLGALPSGNCKLRLDSGPSLNTRSDELIVGGFFANDLSITTSDKNAKNVLGRPLTISQRILRRAISSIVDSLQPRITGRLARFSQLSLGTSSLEGAALGDVAEEVGAIGSGWEVVNFGSAVRPAAVSVKIVDGSPVPELSFETCVPDPCFLSDNICLHELFLRTALSTISGRNHMLSLSQTKFCEIPIASGIIFSAPFSLGWGNVSIEDNVLIPLGRFPAAPATITSACPSDV